MSNKRYPEEFKIEAVRQITERGHKVADVATRLGVTSHSLYAWLKKYGPEAALSGSPQDYMAAPDQLWLDGFCTEKGVVRQFVAMPLGDGYTVEEQITGKAEFGGMQIQVYPMRRQFYDDWQKRLAAERESLGYLEPPTFLRRCVEEPQMGYAPGGKIDQEIYDDPHGVEAWDTKATQRCFVHSVNSVNLS